MAEPYSPKQFFRNVYNVFLIQYFEKNNIEFPLDLYAIKEKQVAVIFDAFLTLDDDTRHKIESDFQKVHALATDAGIISLIEEAKEFENHKFIDTLQGISGLHAKAMWAFIDSPEYWQGASILYQTKIIPSSYWVKINELPALEQPYTSKDVEFLAQAIGEYFFNNEGRGKRCKIDHYKRGKNDYFFAFPEDFAKTAVEWLDNDLQSIPHQMAFEIVFVYCEHTATLDLYARKNAKNIPHLQELFALYILKAKLTNFTPFVENKSYDLEPIFEAGFEFNIPDKSDVYTVQILSAEVTCKNNPSSHVTVTISPNKNKDAVRDRLLKIRTQTEYVSGVKLKVFFKPNGMRTKPAKVVTISMPDKCNLGCSDDDILISEILSASGIEPQPINMSLPCL
ncbi:hypothetical protein WNY51_02610 [Pseudocolwellia sp. AS88]|jgi:hypothetical protein|uniref:hypothetical protein n=1 Tax=Pseudocolwellia sp. AS88 TaxID=3063958 RepID=UPI0026EFA294|nr:hypothetical protein [Pseudocolwellia sp. AS88]MDO7084483.1 hypothetical protein [Pseudocolwellia sp. AS88]